MKRTISIFLSIIIIILVVPLSALSASLRRSEGPAPAETVYALVTDVSDLTSGDMILFVCPDKNVASGPINNTFLGKVDVTIVNNTITVSDGSASAPVPLTLGGSAAAGWTFSLGSGLLSSTAAKSLNISAGGVSTWNISISGGIATVASTEAGFGYIQYNSSSPRFLNYTSSQTHISIYKLVRAAEKTLEDTLIEKVGEKNGGASFDVVIDAPATFEKGKDIEVTVTVKNITVAEGLSQLDFVFSYDSESLVITNTLAADKTVNCAYKLPSGDWDNLSRTKFDENGILNVGKVEVGVVNASDSVSAVQDGDITLKFTFTVNENAEDEIGFYIENASVFGYDWTNFDTIYAGNGSYAITKEKTDGTIITPPARVRGDFDGDGFFTSDDLIYACQLNAYIIDETVGSAEALDVDGDGEFTSDDLIYMCQYNAGVITEWPAEAK